MIVNLLKCLLPQSVQNVTMLKVKGDLETSLMKMDIVPKKKQEMTTKQMFIFEFANHTPFEASFNEEEVVKMMYNQDVLFEKAGQAAMTAFDIALSTGGSEAIVESFYSVMDTQRQVRQHHATFLDWAAGNVLNSEDIIKEAAKLYVDGKDKELPRHRVGNLKKKSEDSYKASQVLSRLKQEKDVILFYHKDINYCICSIYIC